MRVLHVISSGGMYGAEAVVLNLLRELQTGPVRGLLAVFENRGNPQLELHRRAVAAGMESYAIPCRGQADATTLAALRALQQSTGAAAIHAHGYKADVYAALAARNAPWAFLSTCHNWVETDLFARLYGAVDRVALRRARAVVAVSEEVRGKLLASGIGADRIASIRNGIPVAPFQVARQSRAGNAGRIGREPVVGFAGRLSQEKGCDLFLEAACNIRAQAPRTRFLVAGDGPLRASLASEAERLQLSPSLQFLGRCDDMPAFYASCDLLLSPSRTEGLPIGLMEAMSAGLPVVATAVGDVPLLVREGETGLLCAAGDTAAMSSLALALLGDARRCLDYGAAGAARIESEFSARQMAAAYIALYRRVLPRESGLA